MAYEIGVGPAQLTINVGESVLITEVDGQIHQPSERGLFFRDTRLVSAWTVTVDDRPWQVLNSAATDHFAAQIVLVNPALPKDDGEVPAGSVSLALSRLLDQGGMRETLKLCNHNRIRVRLSLAVHLSCDFADIFDVKSHRIVARGETFTHWSPEERCLASVHTNGSFRRGLSVGPADGAPRPVLRDGALRFLVELDPQQSWSTDLAYRWIDGDGTLDGPSVTFAEREQSRPAAALRDWRDGATRLRTPHAGLQQLYDQSFDDLSALRLPFESTDFKTFVPAAGIPWFAALFGRDSLISAIQTVPIYPDFARGALEMLARYQAGETDDTRDMQPGKIPHELRHGEMATLHLNPYWPYYGTADATPLYLILLHHAWQFTGDRDLIERHLTAAERCLAWIDDYGDMDGDGFQEYQRRAPDGAENQGWKDAGNAVLDENGDDVPAPKALCELQGYVYDAWRRMAEIYDALDRPDQARALRDKARDLHRHFNAVFWDESAQFYALCLDSKKRRVMSVCSNPGHLLWSGIVPPERAEAVARRLMAEDMFSGWGVRTLSADHPAYNPHDYQLGAVWPHDNGLIAIGLAQYGFRTEAARIAAGLIAAADRFMLHRLPEVFAGTSRSDSPFPVQYLGANVPQAWAAGSVFSLLHALLGIRVDTRCSTILADPHLPDWLPALTLVDFSVGKQMVDLRVFRDGGETWIGILRGAGVNLVRQRFGTAVEHL
ncbi:glycogen debranching N-terminal domain-containing protein [Methylobacterium durans]|uniref:Amylo-alpha-1,6-glucosidase n=1 Tax=Methylobacterium durans TaxID=2202825 RepID=A0A2U8W0F4_9HYPH|nr:glycogen debranching N-terminal domain-containing protein [Methylobacterium durans]AWN39539.1 amylo-alpha-1,6-glucosidase [Methylobacterium durans]